MELLAAIAALLNIVDLVFKIHNRASINSNPIILSETLNNIGVHISNVADELERGNYPHQSCAAMRQYLNSIDALFNSNKLREAEREKLRTWLIDAVRIEELSAQLNGLSETQRSFNLNMLRSISGSYIACGQIVKL